MALLNKAVPKRVLFIFFAIFLLIGYFGHNITNSKKEEDNFSTEGSLGESNEHKAIGLNDSQTDCDIPLYFVNENSNSKCIDGSKPAFYIRKGKEDGKAKFHIHFEGGGWCYTPELCSYRATTALGSSLLYPKCMVSNKNNNAPYLSDNKLSNPIMYNWNTIFVRYCDGGSYSGNSSMNYQNKTLYFRGLNNRNAVIQDLLANHHLDKASDVVISGCSAGALAVLFGIDDMAEKIKNEIRGSSSSSPSSVSIRGLVDSGIFLDYSYGRTDYDSEGEYPEALNLIDKGLDYSYAMKNVFNSMNLSDGIDANCIEHFSKKHNSFKCVFAENVGKFISTPLFYIQSQYDSWQLKHVLGKYSNISLVNEFGNKVKSIFIDLMLMGNKDKNNNTQNSGFLDSCVHHCMSCRKNYENIWAGETILSKNGNSNINQTFALWWNQGNLKDSSSFSNIFIQDKIYPCNDCCKCEL